MLGRKSRLSFDNRILLYKIDIKPITTNGVKVWRCAKTSNIQIIQLFTSKSLMVFVNAPCYITHLSFRTDLGITFVKDLPRHIYIYNMLSSDIATTPLLGYCVTALSAKSQEAMLTDWLLPATETSNNTMDVGIGVDSCSLPTLLTLSSYYSLLHLE
jgi:hypothetical protein